MYDVTCDASGSVVQVAVRRAEEAHRRVQSAGRRGGNVNAVVRCMLMRSLAFLRDDAAAKVDFMRRKDVAVLRGRYHEFPTPPLSSLHFGDHVPTELLSGPSEDLNEGGPPLALKEEIVSLFSKRARAMKTTGIVLDELGRGVKTSLHWASVLMNTDFSRIHGRMPWEDAVLRNHAKLSLWEVALRPAALHAARSRALLKRDGFLRLAFKLAGVLESACESRLSREYPTYMLTTSQIQDLACQGTWGRGFQFHVAVATELTSLKDDEDDDEDDDEEDEDEDDDDDECGHETPSNSGRAP